MKSTLSIAVALTVTAAAQVAQGSGTVLLKFDDRDVQCTTTAMDLATDGLTVQCLGAFDGTTPPVDPLPVDPLPVDPSPVDPPPVDTTIYLGVDDNGIGVTEADELSGAFGGILYIPNKENPDTIVYPGGVGEVVYPGCAGLAVSVVQDYFACKELGSLSPGVTYAQRLPVATRLPEKRVEMKTRETGDELGSYDFSFSNYPGQLDSVGCMAQSTYAATFYFYPGMCDLPLSDLYNGEIKVYYANFKAVGPKASQCDDGLDCRMYVRAW